jgi:FAD/FMN-containing dehydrogenase
MSVVDPTAATRHVPSRVLDGLRESVRGQLLTDGDPEYERARRVFNSMIDRRPAAILRCAGAADVMAGVNFARDQSLTVAVRGGGHSIAGKSVCNGGLLIDLSGMKGIRIDPEQLQAEAQGGLTLGEFDRETQAFGLATTLGTISTTGIAGLTLGGGIGWLNGRHGLACDNLLEADVVLADGRLVKASAGEHQDLYWALRGGGGNFGIVTSFRYRLHQVQAVWGGMVVHPVSNAARVLHALDEFAAACSDDISLVAAILTGPDGQLAVALAACFCGAVDDGENALRPLRSIPGSVADLFRPMPYTAVQTMFDAAFPGGMRHYWKSGFLEHVSQEAVEVMVAFMRRKPSPSTAVIIQQLHGSAARVPVAATAFPHRRSQYDCGIYSVWSDAAESDANIEWTREFYGSLQPHLGEGVYVNGLGDDGEARIKAAYGPNYGRLVSIKRAYDPSNLFRLNQNIDPRR